MAHQIFGTIPVPPELEILICQNLTKAELKSARLVCKSFDRAAVPFLFDEVFVAASYSDLEIADLTTSRFGLYIKTITLSIVDYRLLSKEEFITYAERRSGRIFERLDAHIEHAFDLYNKARTEDLEIKDSGELLAKLCLTLSRSPNTRKLLMTDYGNSHLCGRRHPMQPHNPWKKDVWCPFKDCKYSESDHIHFLHYPGPPCSTRPEPLQLAMLATSMAKSTITELAIYYRRRALNENSFVMTARESACLKSQFQSLKKLQLRFGMFPGEGPYRGSAVAKALSVAVNLESLHIVGDSPITSSVPNAPTMMSTLLRGCHFPKLESLVLRSVNSRAKELLGFLKKSPSLIRLTLDNFYLESGLWERVIDEICSAFHLRSVMLHELQGRFVERDTYELYRDDYILVEFVP